MKQELKDALGKANIMDLQGIKYIRLDQALDIVDLVFGMNNVPLSKPEGPAVADNIVTVVPPSLLTARMDLNRASIAQHRTDGAYPRIEDARQDWVLRMIAELELRLESIESRHGNVGYAGPVRVYEKNDASEQSPIIIRMSPEWEDKVFTLTCTHKG